MMLILLVYTLISAIAVIINGYIINKEIEMGVEYVKMNIVLLYLYCLIPFLNIYVIWAGYNYLRGK